MKSGSVGNYLSWTQKPRAQRSGTHPETDDVDEMEDISLDFVASGSVTENTSL